MNIGLVWSIASRLHHAIHSINLTLRSPSCFYCFCFSSTFVVFCLLLLLRILGRQRVLVWPCPCHACTCIAMLCNLVCCHFHAIFTAECHLYIECTKVFTKMTADNGALTWKQNIYMAKMCVCVCRVSTHPTKLHEVECQAINDQAQMRERESERDNTQPSHLNCAPICFI